MSIADDIKTLFRYINNWDLFTQEIIDTLTSGDKCAPIFASGKFPLLLEIDEDKNVVEQRKFNTRKSRYYLQTEIKINHANKKYLLTNNIYETQRDKYYEWFRETFNMNPEEIIVSINFYYVKLSCPAKDDDYKFGQIMENLEKEKAFIENLHNIPNKLTEAKHGDIIFLQIGGDASNKRKYFNNNIDLEKLENGLYAVGLLESTKPNSKKLTAKFYPFKSPVTKMDLYLYPQFIDNLGCVTKGIPNQAGLYELDEETGKSFIEYLYFNRLTGTATDALDSIDYSGYLLKAGKYFYDNNEHLLTSQSFNKFKRLYSDQNRETSDYPNEIFQNPNNKSSEKLLSILPKSFLLLAGISGTGKSRFVAEQAKASADALNLKQGTNYCLVPVRPDWHEPSDLLGYISRINGTRYIATEFLKFLVKALCFAAKSIEDDKIQWKSTETIPPFWLCLDEMNLAPVEQYFADYLSIVETRKWDESAYISDAMLKNDILQQLANSKTDDNANSLAVLLEELFDGIEIENELKEDLCSYFKNNGIPLPPNLIVAGTVNMDETTHGFSRKVIDRALTIDFQEFFPNNFDAFFEGQSKPKIFSFPIQSEVNQDQLGCFEQGGKQMDSLSFIKSINDILKGTPFELAYRALNELFLLEVCFLPKIDVEFQGLWDDFLMQKVLPRIEGDSPKLKSLTKQNAVKSKYLSEHIQDLGKGTILHEVYDLLECTLFKDIWEGTRRPDLLRDTEENIECRSKKKLEWMMKRLKSNHFTDFWV